MFNRQLTYPILSAPITNTDLIDTTRDCIIKAKQKAKRYYDGRKHTKHSSLRIGDLVITKQDKRNKLSTTFKYHPYTVTAIIKEP